MKVHEKGKNKNEKVKFQIVSHSNVRSKFFQENNNLQNKNKSNIEIKSPQIDFNEVKNDKETVVIKNESSYLVLKSFLREHQVKPPSIFILYLSEIWRELSIYSSNSNNGILPFAFSKFFPLPGLPIIVRGILDVIDINMENIFSINKEFLTIPFSNSI